MATVTVPAEFFRAELRVYSDWREAFARELLQNALDAKPSAVNAKFDTVDGHGRVVFTDDGHGMSRRVLDEVFFALGRTTKNAPDSIGGFGRARIIICFAQTRYRIRTGRLLVEGEGGEYTISDVAAYQPGCEFTIDLLDEDPSKVKSAFESLLRTCNTQVPVTLDGRPAPSSAMPGRASRVMRDDAGNAWAKVYVNPDSFGRMVTRVHGLTMFSRWLPGSDDVIVELVPARSREVLSASRDQLHTAFGTQINHFVADLSSNRRRALRPADAPLDVRVGGGGFMRTDATVNTGSYPQVEQSTRAASPVEWSATVAVHPANDTAAANMAMAAYTEPGRLNLGIEPQVPAGRSLGFDVYLMADAPTARVRKLARAWDPSFWDERTGRRRRALLLAWKAAVSTALDLLVARHPELGEVLWTVGWTFDTEVEAVHRSAGKGHVLALNPVDEAGTMRYQISSRADRQRMLAAALHEVAHVGVENHDERFASLLTALFGELDPVEADRAMRDAATLA